MLFLFLSAWVITFQGMKAFFCGGDFGNEFIRNNWESITMFFAVVFSIWIISWLITNPDTSILLIFFSIVLVISALVLRYIELPWRLAIPRR